jgi:PPOX class probable F420-dependent enzyme
MLPGLEEAISDPAERRLRDEQEIWITTVRSDGQPQSSLVGFLWDGREVLVLSQPEAGKIRNLRDNPKVAATAGRVGCAATVSRPRDLVSIRAWRPYSTTGTAAVRCTSCSRSSSPGGSAAASPSTCCCRSRIRASTRPARW